MKKYFSLFLALVLLCAASCAEHPVETTPEETTCEETTMSPEAILDILMNTCWLSIEDADGEIIAPFQSINYASFWETSLDGTLAFSPLEDALLVWVSQGKIPMISLGDRARLLDAVSGEVIEGPIYFNFFTEKEGVFEKRKSLDPISFSELYRYCTEHFAGETVYVCFDRTRDVHEAGEGHASYTYVFCAEIP